MLALQIRMNGLSDDVCRLWAGKGLTLNFWLSRWWQGDL